MKLFYQLSEQLQNNALNHFSELVIKDMIEDGIKLDPINDEEIILKEKLEDAVDHIKQFSTVEEKTNYLLNDADISRAIYDIAMEMSKSAFFIEKDEMIVFIDDISEASDDETNLLLPMTTTKKISDLN